MSAIYINVAMGLGGNISLTYITKELHEKYDKVCVMSPYFDVFLSDPNVDSVYKPEEAADFVKDAKYENAYIMTQRLYDMSDFIYKRLSYSDAWRILCGLEPKGDGEEGSSGEHTLNPYKPFPNVKNDVEKTLKEIKDKSYKNFIIVNFEGNVSPLQNIPDGDWSKVPNNYDNEPLKRLYPRELAQEFINIYHEAHPETAIINYSLPNQSNYENSEKFIMPYLAYYELAKNELCKGAVTIDSSCQHLISGCCPVVTLWAHSLPNSFGHVGNKNIIQDCRRDDILYFSLLGPSGAKIKYIDPKELFDTVEEYF